MLLAATLTRKLAAESPDVAIESMLMPSVYRTSHTCSLTPSVKSAAFCFHPRNHAPLPRRHAERLLEALGIARPNVGIDDAWRALAVERLQHLLGGDAAHVPARLDGDACCMRARQHIVELEQRMLRR